MGCYTLWGACRGGRPRPPSRRDGEKCRQGWMVADTLDTHPTVRGGVLDTPRAASRGGVIWLLTRRTRTHPKGSASSTALPSLTAWGCPNTDPVRKSLKSRKSPSSLPFARGAMRGFCPFTPFYYRVRVWAPPITSEKPPGTSPGGLRYSIARRKVSHCPRRHAAWLDKLDIRGYTVIGNLDIRGKG